MISFQLHLFLDWRSALCLQIKCLQGTVPVSWFSQHAEISLLILIRSLREDVSLQVKNWDSAFREWNLTNWRMAELRLYIRFLSELWNIAFLCISRWDGLYPDDCLYYFIFYSLGAWLTITWRRCPEMFSMAWRLWPKCELTTSLIYVGGLHSSKFNLIGFDLRLFAAAHWYFIWKSAGNDWW